MPYTPPPIQLDPGGTARLPAGTRHDVQVIERHYKATRIDPTGRIAPGQTVIFTASEGTSFQVRRDPNGRRTLVPGSERPATTAELRRLRWRVHCGGALLADTALHEGPLRVTLGARLPGESVFATAYTWQPKVGNFKSWWVEGRSGAGGGTLENVRQLASIITACGKVPPSHLGLIFEHLARGFSRPPMNSTLQQAHFLAQAIHESVGLGDLDENITREVAGRRYRETNGNESRQDGWDFRGRGIMQITGFNGYKAVFRAYLGREYPQFASGPAEREWIRGQAPRLASDPGLAVQAGFHFWMTKPVHDRAARDDVLGASIRVNGWNTDRYLPNGWDERVRFTHIVKQHLGLRR